MKTSLAQILLISAMIMLCGAHREYCDGRKEHNEKVFKLIRESHPLVENITIRTSTQILSSDTLITFYARTETSLDYVVTNKLGDIITQNVIFETGLNNSLSGFIQEADIILNNKNMLVVVGNFTHLFAFVLNPEGRVVVDQYLIASTAGPAFPSLYRFDDRVLLLIQEAPPGTDGSVIYPATLRAVVLSADGTTVETEIFNVTDTPILNAQSIPNLHSDIIPVAWIASEEESSFVGPIYFRTIDANGNLGEEILVNEGPADGLIDWIVLDDCERKALLVWEQPTNENFTEFHIFAQRFDLERMMFIGDAVQITPIVTQSSFVTKVLRLPNGKIFWTWMDGTTIKGLITNKRLETVEDAFNINNPLKAPAVRFLTSYYNSVSLYNHDLIFVSWVATCGEDGITAMANFVTLDGRRVLEKDKNLLHVCDPSIGVPDALIFPEGKITVIWRDPRIAEPETSTLYHRLLKINNDRLRELAYGDRTDSSSSSWDRCSDSFDYSY